MSDLINRQNAINTALEFFVEFLGGAFHEDDQKILMKRMNELPSAEPKTRLVAEITLNQEQIQSAVDNAVEKIRAEMEEPEIIRCRDCKHNQGNACDYSSVWTRPNGFCQWGERKDDAPTANPVKHGHWEVLHHFEYRCSQCGEHWNTESGIKIEDLRYCPRCGARMDSEEMME